MLFEIKNHNPHRVSECTTDDLPKLNANALSYEDFFENYLTKNQPCIIQGVAENWECTKKWITESQPNLQYLYDNYKDTNVIIYNCSEKYFNSQKCYESTLSEYLKLWHDKTDCVYYLKDWHLKLQRESDTFYQVPIYFASDWLNEYYIECTSDDYRFVYMGQKGSWTPLHSDVFNSFSWSVNVCGKKRWVFFPPGQENLLRDNLNNIPYDVSTLDQSVKCFEIVQDVGEAVFVPSSWYHQVWNLEDTISINHNWVNGCNIGEMWRYLKLNLVQIEKEIDDCKNMEGFIDQCQLMLKALCGMDFTQFFQFVQFIAQKRISQNSTTEMFHGHIPGPNHIKFDLIQISRVLSDMPPDNNVQSLLDTISIALNKKTL